MTILSSYGVGKAECCGWVRQNFHMDSTVLDVGACDGVWQSMLPEYDMDAVEAFQPNAENLKRHNNYMNVYCTEIKNFEYEWYDLIIFGDVIEHMDVETAQAVLEYAYPRCRDMIIAVPFLYEQGEIYGNPYERHIQPELTFELFAKRYPDYEVLVHPVPNYCYYHKKGQNNG